MSKPSILLAPGSFTLPDFYDAVAKPITAAGYNITVLHLPSAGTAPDRARSDWNPPPTMYDDTAAIIAETIRLIGGEDGDGDVILLAHSYGGVPMTESVKGLGKTEREKKGKKGGIVALGYMTSLVVPVGMSAGVGPANLSPEKRDEICLDEKGWFYFRNPSVVATFLFSDLPSDEAEAWTRRCPRHSAASFAGELTYAGYKDVPVHYLLCEKDAIISPETQRSHIEIIERESGRRVKVTTIQADHCAMASQPQKVVDWVLEIVEAIQD